MSLPSREELLEASRGLGFAERIKYGAKLGYDHETNPALHTLLQSVRNYDVPENPTLDAASVQIAKFLPTQQLHGAKHFDTEQVVLAAATAVDDVETLKTEIRGPTASNITYACTRLAKISPKDEVTSKALFELVKELPDKRRKPMLKALVEYRQIAVLELYLEYLQDSKDKNHQIVAFIHGCSRETVVKHLPSLLESSDLRPRLCVYHLARYQGQALMDLLESSVKDLANDDITAKWAEWNVFFTAAHGNRALTILLTNKDVAARLLNIAVKYPAMKSQWNNGAPYHPTPPQLILAGWTYFTKHFPKQLFKLAKQCVYPIYDYLQWTFDPQTVVKDRAQIMQFLEQAIPPSVQTHVADWQQYSMPQLFNQSAMNALRELSYMPEVLNYAKTLKDWVDRYSKKYPALEPIKHSLYIYILNAGFYAIAQAFPVAVDKFEIEKRKTQRRLNEAGKDVKKDLKQEDIHFKPIDFGERIKAENALFALFSPHLKALMKAGHVVDAKAVKDRDGQKKADRAWEAFVQFWPVDTVMSFDIVNEYIQLLKQYQWTSVDYLQKWRDGHRTVFDFAFKALKTSEDFGEQLPLIYTKEQLERTKQYGQMGFSVCFDLVKLDPADWQPQIIQVIKSLGTLSWERVAPFNKLITTENLKEMMKRAQESDALAILRSTPLAERQVHLAALLEPKVTTQAQRQLLQSLLTVHDPKNRRNFELATSSSSPVERIAALCRMVQATTTLPMEGSRSHKLHLANADACAVWHKESTTTLAFIVKRLKNAVFHDRVVFSRLAFHLAGGKQPNKAWSTVWFAPGVGPAQFALWKEFLDDHIQHSGRVTAPVNPAEIENWGLYSDGLSEFKVTSTTIPPNELFVKIIKSALSIGIRRNDTALVVFAFEMAVKLGSADNGAGDPLGSANAFGLIPFQPLANILIQLKNPEVATSMIEKLKTLYMDSTGEAELKVIKGNDFFRTLLSHTPVTQLRYVPPLLAYLKTQYETELAAVRPLQLSDINSPPKLPTGFEDDAEKEIQARKLLFPALIKKHATNVWRVPILVDYVFNIALKSWAAGDYVDIAFSVRSQQAFHAHKFSFTGPAKQYLRPTGDTLRKMKSEISLDFAKELVQICPSALHIPRIQRIIADSDPTLFATYIPYALPSADDIADEEAKLEHMRKAALLGPFTHAPDAPTAVAGVARAAPAPRGRPMRGRRGGRMARRAPVRHVVARVAPTPAQTLDAQIVSQLAIVRDIVKKWRRGQSTKSLDNTYHFLPTLCYDTTHWHAHHIAALGVALQDALLNPMRPLSNQKKFVILWTLLPTTTYADIVLFLQKHDFNFFPQIESAEPAEDDNDENSDEKAKSKEAAKKEDDKNKPQLPLAVVETAIRGTTMNDEPLAPLAFLLSPTFLSSNYSRTAIAAVQSVMNYVPGGLLTEALSYLLNEHRQTLKTTAHKQIIRFLAEHVSLSHWDILLNEWKNPKTHRDVRITILNAAFQALSVASGDILDRVWSVLELATAHKEADVVAALLKTRPFNGPRRDPYKGITLDIGTHLLNGRVKNQWKDYTEIVIPAECTPRYYKSIIEPILEKSPLGSDINFIAYTCLPKWAAYLRPATDDDEDGPATPHYGVVCERFVHYLLESFHADTPEQEAALLFASDKKRESDVAVNRWSLISSVVLWLFSINTGMEYRSTAVASLGGDAAQWDIPERDELMILLTTSLVARWEYYHHGKGQALPSNTIRYRIFSNLSQAIIRLVTQYDNKAVPKQNATVDQQDEWFAPIEHSPLREYLYDTTEFFYFKLNQIVPTNTTQKEFFSVYNSLVPYAAAGTHRRGVAQSKIIEWLRSLPGTYLNPFLTQLLCVQDRKWANDIEKSTDLAMVATITTNMISSMYYDWETVAKPFIEFVELMFKLHSGVERMSVKFSQILPSLVSMLTNSFGTMMYPTYYSMSTVRRKILKWVIDKALEHMAAFDAMDRPSTAQREHVALWRSFLNGINGVWIASFVPSLAPKVIDAVARSSALDYFASTIVNHWILPDSYNVDLAQAGVGYMGVDHAFAFKVLEKMITLSMTETAPNDEFAVRIYSGLVNVCQQPKTVQLLYSNSRPLYWQLYNGCFLLAMNFPFSSAIRQLATEYLTAPIQEDYGKADPDTTSAVQLIKDLLDGVPSKYGLAPKLEALLPFDTVKPAYLKSVESQGVTLLVQLGESLAVMPPKEANSTVKVWRPEFRALADKIASTSSATARTTLASSYFTLTTKIVSDQPAK